LCIGHFLGTFQLCEVVTHGSVAQDGSHGWVGSAALFVSGHVQRNLQCSFAEAAEHVRAARQSFWFMLVAVQFACRRSEGQNS
jgi:hypothetical protein